MYNKAINYNVSKGFPGIPEDSQETEGHIMGTGVQGLKHAANVQEGLY